MARILSFLLLLYLLSATAVSAPTTTRHHSGTYCQQPSASSPSQISGVQGNYRRVPGRRRGVRSRQREQPAHFSDEEVYQLQCAEEGQHTVLAPRGLLLQLPPWGPGQPLLSWLLEDHALPELRILLLCRLSLLLITIMPLDVKLLLLSVFILYISRLVVDDDGGGDC
ncbi:uncharacterized protein A4U43_C08F31540 [Asparagus officinalis]|nr:uncharacterized protein A4U43_C08F31540 [Asparagus officinalis]